MKKFLIGFILVVLLLLSTLYLALNSPYVVDKFARKYAPKYGFDYERISGNPLKGIILDNLSYRGQRLARRIHIRVNPYTLLKKELTVSKLSLLDVDVPVLEQVILDFTVPPSESNVSQSSGMVLPLAIEAQKIHLTLLPFRRYGVEVYKEELSVDSIYYDSGVFNVGRLRQIAETSLGTVELEGTYHKRFLDVKLLAIDDLDLSQLQKLLKTLESFEGKEPAAAHVQGEKIPAAGATTTSLEEDIFLPLKIHADRLWLTLRPYEIEGVAKIDWAQMEGRGLLIDLKRYRIREGVITAELRSDLGNARVKAAYEEGNATLEEGVLDRVDLAKILSLLKAKKKATVTEEEKKSTASTEPLDGLPFVPPGLKVQQLRIELKPGEYAGVKYRNTILSIKNLRANLHTQRIVAQKISANLDTPQAHLNLDAAIDEKMIRIRQLEINDLNLTAIREFVSAQKGEGLSSPSASIPSNTNRSPGQELGITLPFVPSSILLEEGLIRLDPYQIAPLQLEEARASLKGLRLNLTKRLATQGRVAVDLRSNLATGRLSGKIRDNVLTLDSGEESKLRLKQGLFQILGTPLRTEAFSPIGVSGKIDPNTLDLNLSFSAHKILTDRNASFNVDIDHSVTGIVYRFSDGSLQVKHESRIATPQAPSMLLRATLGRRGEALHYQGRLEVGALKLGEEKIERILSKPRIEFAGDLHSLEATLDAGILGGRFVSRDLKKGRLEIGSKKLLKPSKYFKLPKKLKEATVSFRLISPIDFTKPLPLDANVTLHSNLAEIEGRIGYDGNLTMDLVTTFPKNSLLKKLDPKFKLSALNPLRLKLEQKGEKWHLLAKSKVLNIQTDYDLTDDELLGIVRIAGTRIDLSGRLKETISAKLSSPSVKKLISGIQRIYAVEVPRLDGDVAVTLKVEKLSKMTLELRSKQFVPDATARIKSPIKNILVLLWIDLKGQSLIVKKYHLEIAGMKLFADKPSILQRQKNRLILKELWINDSLKAQGYYDLKKAKGEVTAKSARFKVKHQNADLEAAIDIRARIIGEKIDASGKITLLGGTVMYDIQAKRYASDEDIVILQHLKKNKESFFRKNVQLTLYIETKKPLLFKQKNAYVELRPQLSILKGFDGDLQLMGSIPLAKDGYYIFEGKRFTLRPSSINFTGKPTQPLLDINLVYRRYSRTVYISVNGPATEPILNFSSDPYMTREQILSFILFDTVDSGESAGDMLTMVGGGIAKSILGNLGLKVDTLVLTGQGFEVGKKITDKITIIYDQKSAEPKVVVRIQHSKRTETDISIGSESQSVDIIYKREF